MVNKHQDGVAVDSHVLGVCCHKLVLLPQVDIYIYIYRSLTKNGRQAAVVVRDWGVQQNHDTCLVDCF